MLISCAPAACQNPATETCISMADAIQKSVLHAFLWDKNNNI